MKQVLRLGCFLRCSAPPMRRITCSGKPSSTHKLLGANLAPAVLSLAWSLTILDRCSNARGDRLDHLPVVERVEHGLEVR